MKDAAMKRAILPTSDPRADLNLYEAGAQGNADVDPRPVSATIHFVTGLDGKEATTTPIITVQCRDNGPVVVADYAIMGTGPFDYRHNYPQSPDYPLQVTNDDQATKSKLSGGDYWVRISTDGDDGWDFVPTLTVWFSDGSHSQFAGTYTRLTTATDSAQYGM